MIKKLFGKILLSCDFPGGCQKYLHLKKVEDANRIVKENRWLAVSVGDRILFLCGQCQGRVAGMPKPEWEKMKASVTQVREEL